MNPDFIGGMIIKTNKHVPVIVNIDYITKLIHEYLLLPEDSIKLNDIILNIKKSNPGCLQQYGYCITKYAT